VGTNGELRLKMSNVTGNMGLTIWDELSDEFDYGQLEDNWIAVDGHDHSPEKGVPIGTNGIANNAITQPKLAIGAVATVNIQNFAVGTNQIAEASITGDKIQPGSITGSDLANGAVSWPQLDPAMFPLGWIGLWFSPGGVAPGGVWEVMDGRAWSSIPNAFGLNTGVIPDLLDAFALGVHPNQTGITGGTPAIDIAHAHTVTGGTITIPSHNHSISQDGQHLHTFGGGFTLATRQNAIPPGRTLNLIGPNNSVIPVTDFTLLANGFAGFYNLGNAQIDDIANITTPVAMDATGLHSHGGLTGTSTPISAAASGTTDQQLSAGQSIYPPFVGLCYIMKVRNS
jgi:hypothetical protein